MRLHGLILIYIQTIQGFQIFGIQIGAGVVIRVQLQIFIGISGIIR